MSSILQNFKDRFTYDFQELLVTKKELDGSAGHFFFFFVNSCNSFKGHFQMLAAYHHLFMVDLKLEQDLKAKGGVSIG